MPTVDILAKFPYFFPNTKIPKSPIFPVFPDEFSHECTITIEIGKIVCSVEILSILDLKMAEKVHIYVYSPLFFYHLSYTLQDHDVWNVMGLLNFEKYAEHLIKLSEPVGAGKTQ